MRKLVFRVSNQVQHKPGCIATEDGERLEISDLGIRGVAKTKMLITCAVTVTKQLICTFVFAYAKSRFSHVMAHTTVNKFPANQQNHQVLFIS